MIGKAISKAIKNQSWLAIEYRNKENEVTNYWIAINDIDVTKKLLYASAFNVTKISNTNSGVITICIAFDKIVSAYEVSNTKYEQPLELVNKIETNIEALDWLPYDTYNDQVLDYIHECMISEETPYQKESTLVRSLDQDAIENLRQQKKYILNHMQIHDLVTKLESLSKQGDKYPQEITTLALNYLSISTKKGLYVVAYKILLFDPSEQSLLLQPQMHFNYSFTSSEDVNFKHNIKNYLDIEADDFLDLYCDNPIDAKAMLQEEVLKRGESLDERPSVMEILRTYHKHIENEIDCMKKRKINHDLSIPLKAFFGNMSASFLRGGSRQSDIIITDHDINIDQLRVVYNALTKPITYVQGPPGTGKTYTIISVIISAFFNGDTILVSSNNNKPINDIYAKLQKMKGKNREIFLPFIRLGNKEETLKSLNSVKKILPSIKKYDVRENKLDIYAKISVEDMKKINKSLSDYEEVVELQEQLDVLKTMQEKLVTDLRGVVISSLIKDKEEELKKYTQVDENEIKKYTKKVDSRFLDWLFYTGVKDLQRIFEPKNKDLINIIQLENDDDKLIQFNKYIREDDNLNNFQKIFPVILTTNQSSYRLGSQSESFDLAIIDEAGQSSIGYSLFTIARAKRLLLVGDQNQLKPVIDIAPENHRYLLKKYEISDNYNYLENSILLSMQKSDTISKFVLLRYHYRSHPDIIHFSNTKYYHGQLKVSYKKPLNVAALEYIKVSTKNDFKQSQKNISFHEANTIIQDIKEKGYKNVGVITPFRNQADLIKEQMKYANLDHVQIGTIHTFQGDEKEVIYLSTGITKHTSPKAFDWLKNHQELINVATTRACDKFIMVADEEELTKRSVIQNDLMELYQYVKAKGKDVTLTPSAQTYFINGANFKNYDTIKEKEFFDTINHILTTTDKFILKSKVRIQSIIGKYKNEKEYDYSLKGEFDLVIFKELPNMPMVPIVAIELDGNEHTSDVKVIRRDKIKQDICKDNNLKLIRIDNKYSRRYMYIKDLLIEILRN